MHADVRACFPRGAPVRPGRIRWPHAPGTAITCRGMQNGCPPNGFRNKIKRLFGSWKKQRRRGGAHSHRETRSYTGILLATLFWRLRWSSASTASSLSGRRLLNVPLRVPATITHSGPLPRVAHTDVVIVVVLCSREAVCFACQTWLDSPLKHQPAAPRAPPQSANRKPRGLVVHHTV